MLKKTVRDKNVRDGSADNAIFKRKIYFKKSVAKIAKFRSLKNSNSHCLLSVLFFIIGLLERTRSSCDLLVLITSFTINHRAESWKFSE